MKRGVKIVGVLALIYIFFRIIHCFKTDRQNKTGLEGIPLLEQSVNKQFNRENVWISMSFCYSAALPYEANSDAVIKAVLASRLWKVKNDANIVVQVYNDTEIHERDIERLKVAEKSGTHLIWADRSKMMLCDCALGHSLGRLLLHTVPEIRDLLSDDSIVMLANVDAFVSKGEFLNVLQSRHTTWIFNAESLLYVSQPFPTNFIAMTVENWKKTTYNSKSCSELVETDSHISSEYRPPWSVKSHKHKNDKIETTEIDINMAVSTTEKFITRRILRLKHCTVPPWIPIWADLKVSEAWDPNFFDLDICWKGMGLASCSNAMGYWHYPGMTGCNWWTAQFPMEVFQEIIKAGDPLREMIKETSVLFSSR